MIYLNHVSMRVPTGNTKQKQNEEIRGKKQMRIVSSIQHVMLSKVFSLFYA